MVNPFLSLSLSVSYCLFVCLPIYLPVCLSMYPSLFLYLLWNIHAHTYIHTYTSKAPTQPASLCTFDGSISNQYILHTLRSHTNSSSCLSFLFCISFLSDALSIFISLHRYYPYLNTGQIHAHLRDSLLVFKSVLTSLCSVLLWVHHYSISMSRLVA